jgi:adenylate kinase
MNEYTIIFIGKSGCGKGTQIEKLTEFFRSKGESLIESLEAGKNLREFISDQTYTSKLAQANNVQGKLQPVFLAIWAWVNKMIETYTGQKILFVDGAPRKLSEAIILNEMFDFYDRKNRYLIHIDVSDEWTKERLHERGRGDDTDESIVRRLNWFNTNSPDIISFFKNQNTYQVITINGEQDIESVHKDILKNIEL